jgi:hypothetical protein
LGIADQCGVKINIVCRLLVELDCFSSEDIISIIGVFRSLFSICGNSNQLINALSKNADWLISEILKKFSLCKVSNFYGDVLSMLMSKRKLLYHLLNIEVLRSLSTYINNPKFAISSAALSVFTKLLIPEDESVHLVVSTFIEFVNL